MEKTETCHGSQRSIRDVKDAIEQLVHETHQNFLTDGMQLLMQMYVCKSTTVSAQNMPLNVRVFCLLAMTSSW